MTLLWLPTRPRDPPVQRPTGIKRLERKFRRLRLYLFWFIYEVTRPRYALHCFVTHVETWSAPTVLQMGAVALSSSTQPGLYASICPASKFTPFVVSSAKRVSNHAMNLFPLRYALRATQGER